MVDVVLVVLPVTADYQALHPNGRADVDDFVGRVRRAADQSGARLIDLHTETNDGWFADTHHLNQTGADELSRRLPELLAEQGVEARRCR